MSEVESVNGKTGVVKLPGLTEPGGELPSSVVSDSRGKASGDLLVFEESSFQRLPVGSPGEDIVIRSDGSVAYIPMQKVHLAAWTKKAPTEDCSADFKTALEKAMELDAVLVLPKECTLTNEVAIVNNANLRMCIEGAGAQYSTIVDKCTAGPCLRYERTDSQQGGWNWRGFTFKLECHKPEHNMVEMIGLNTASFVNEEVWWTGKSGTEFKCRSGILMKDLWEGSFNNCRWKELLGHEVWYENPTLNGGNVAFSDCQGQNCSGGTVVLGAFTTNNVSFKNRKWVAQEGREFYEKITTGLPKIGAKEITLAKEINKTLAYLSNNRTVVLVSGAGVDILHINTYTEATGVLTFYDEATKEHAAHSDMRVICCKNWSLITGFYTPALELSDCHTEQCPAFICESPGLTVRSHTATTNQSSFTGEKHIFYLVGAKTYDIKFTNIRMGVNEASKNAAVCPLAVEGFGTPSFEIDGVNAYSANPSMTNEEYRPFWSPDAVYQSTTEYPTNIRVKTKTGGVERESMIATETNVGDLGNITGKTSAELDAKLATLPATGTLIATGEREGKQVVLTRKTGAGHKWQYASLTQIE